MILLCLAKKSRDADHLQNFVYDQQAGLDPETLDRRTAQQAGEYVPIPDYAYDCHTPRGPQRWARPRRTSSRPSRTRSSRFIPGLFDDLIDS